MSAWEMKGWKDVGLGGQKTEGKGREEGQRRIRGSEMGKSRGLRRGLSPHLTHLRREAVVSSPRRAAGAPGATRWLRRRGPTGVGVGKGFASGWAGGRSVVELALARLVDEAALVPGPARTALAGAVLPLNHLGAQRLALRPRPGPLQPPRLARLLQQSSARRRRGGCVARGPRLSQDWCQLPFAQVAAWRIRVGVRGRGSRLQHYGAAGDVHGHAGVLDEEVLQRAALQARGPEAGPVCSEAGGRGNKPALVQQGGRGRRAARGGGGGRGGRTARSRGAVRQVDEEPAVHFFLRGHERAGAVGAPGRRGRGRAEEEAGEAPEHGGRAKRLSSAETGYPGGAAGRVALR